MNLANAIERLRLVRPTLSDSDAQALAVCLEVLAGHAHDGGALLREVNPKARTPIDTTNSAPPLTPEERMR